MLSIIFAFRPQAGNETISTGPENPSTSQAAYEGAYGMQNLYGGMNESNLRSDASNAVYPQGNLYGIHAQVYYERSPIFLHFSMQPGTSGEGDMSGYYNDYHYPK